jgi:DNA repair exonuclease SbcCD nuclease subunit
LGLITDVHLGPVRMKDGTPVKLTGYAEPLAREVVQTWRARDRPDLVLNLGDVLEDVSPEQDRAHYERFLEVLSEAGAPALHVAGNHDQVHLSDRALLGLWGLPAAARVHAGSTAYGVAVGGFHFVVLSTHFGSDGVFLGDGQLGFLKAELERAEGPVLLLTHQGVSDAILTGNHWFEHDPHTCLVHERAEIRRLLEQSGKVAAAFNGHAHWNHLAVAGGIPYVTLQSLTENVTRDGEPTPAATYAVVDIDPSGMHVRVEGRQPARYQMSFA